MSTAARIGPIVAAETGFFTRLAVSVVNTGFERDLVFFDVYVIADTFVSKAASTRRAFAQI